MMREFIIRSAKSMPESDLLNYLESALKLYKEKPTKDNKTNLEMYLHMLTIKYEKSTADELINEMSQFERTKDFFTPNKN